MVVIMNKSPLVIKLGGAVLSSEQTLTLLFTTISNYQQQANRPLIIVHGGGYLVDELMGKLQFKTIKKEGLRVTPKDQVGYIAGALAGTANKMLQGQAIKSGINAIGLSLADGGLCQIKQLDVELGNVGLAKPGNAAVLNAILAAAATPIISSIGITCDGELMNVNADQAAVAVATTLDADLVFLSDVPGVLNVEKQLINSLNSEQAELLIQQEVITDGMIIKVRAALEAAQQLGRTIEVASWCSPRLCELFDGNSIGTQFLPH